MTTDASRHDDLDTRAVLDHLDTKLDEKLKNHVTWQGLAGSVVALVGLIFVVVSAFMAPVKENQAQMRADAKETKTEISAAVREVRQEVRDARREFGQLSAEIRAVRSVTVDGRSRERVGAELRKTHPEVDE